MRQAARTSFLFVLLFTLHVSVAQAETAPADWMVVEASGAVEIQDGAQQKLATQAGAVLVPPFTITTGNDGRAVISHGQDRLSVGADSRVGVPLPTAADSGLVTRIRQTLGSVLYQVEHRIKTRFEVDTPFLVSVVKGTTFNIHATLEDSTVALIEGKLWVHTPDLKSEVILTPGQAAIKSHHGKTIIVKDQQALSTPQAGPITIENDSTGGTAQDQVAGLASPGTPSDLKTTSHDSEKRALAQSSSDGAGAVLAAPSADTAVPNGASLNLQTDVSGGNPLVVNTRVGGISSTASVAGGSGLDVGAGVGGASTGIGIAVGAASTGINAGSGSLLNVSTDLSSVTSATAIGGGSGVSVGSATSGGVTAAPTTTTTGTTPGITQVPVVGGTLGNLLK